ncbi:hypothetical protein RDWZM_000023 [Blomia tropicalis]|uniref:Carbonic anhydrase n=1 Tax=Blomia tropicalis TaxID=40697 RepID=A0A9Q0M7T8_BLOTA|nr:hypothetical protein RDWZM_000023 [Blomia tropicalis]
MNVSMNLDFYGYQNLIFGFNVVNNGHSVQFNYIGDERSAPILTGSALNHENYSLAQFHFHWAQDRGYGSEHTVNDKSYSMEMHLVHFNRYRYSTLKDALDSGKGVVVLGVFFQIERKNNDLLNEVTRMVHVVQDRHSNFTANPEQPLVVDHLLPNAFNRKKFYRYSGSLTTPPCTEGVTWIVMAHPNNIGYEQIEQFRKVRNYHKKELIGSNYRNTQSVRDRLVEASFNAQRDSTASTKLSGMLVTLSLVSLLFANRNH